METTRFMQLARCIAPRKLLFFKYRGRAFRFLKIYKRIKTCMY